MTRQRMKGEEIRLGKYRLSRLPVRTIVWNLGGASSLDFFEPEIFKSYSRSPANILFCSRPLTS